MNDKERFENYIEYLRNYDKYFNPLEALNMGENSMSQLLAWLLDVHWIYDNENKKHEKENVFHYNFCLDFLKLIKQKENISNEKEKVLNKLTPNQIHELAKNMKSEQDVQNIDILLTSEYTDAGKNKKGFVCVIENKKRAKLSNSKIKNNNTRQLQIEKYSEYLDKNFDSFDKKFVYLCAEKNDTKKTIEEGLVDLGKVPDDIKNNLIFKHQKYEQIKDRTVAWALKEFNYTIIEHSDVVMILHNILHKISKVSFENGILKPISQKKMFDLITKVKELYHSTKAKSEAEKIINIQKKIISNYKIRCQKDIDKIFRYEKDIKNEEIKISISSNAKMFFWNYFDNKHNPFKEYEDRINLLCRYVEYWELHKGIQGLSDNIDGYTKIVDGKYIWDVCKKLSKNKKYWNNKKEEATKLNNGTLNELIKYIDISNNKDKSKELIKDFVNEILEGKIADLKDFSFLNLHSNRKYIQDEYKDKIRTEQIKKYGGYFLKKGFKPTEHQFVDDYDDMNLMRAINYLLYENNNLPELKWEDLDWEYEKFKPDYDTYNYRGETINTFNTLINESYYKEFFQDIENGEILAEKINKFMYKVFSIGNFMLLPNKRIDSISLNKYKGNYYGDMDYSDIFFIHILKKDDKVINSLLDKNNFWYDRFKSKKDLKNFISDNYLMDYFTNGKLNYEFSKHYKHGDFDSVTNKEDKKLYAEYIKEYIDVVTAKIDARAKRMIKDLEKFLT